MLPIGLVCSENPCGETDGKEEDPINFIARVDEVENYPPIELGQDILGFFPRCSE